VAMEVSQKLSYSLIKPRTDKLEKKFEGTPPRKKKKLSTPLYGF